MFKKLNEGGGGSFIALNDGESVEGCFRGEPYEFFNIYLEKPAREYPNYIPGSSFRFRINFIVKEDDKYVAKKLERGVTDGKRIQYLLEEHGMDSLYKVKRQGAKGSEDTIYHIDFKASLTPEQKKNIDAVKLVELPYVDPNIQIEKDVQPEDIDDGDIPF